MENEKIEIPTPLVNELVVQAVEENVERINKEEAQPSYSSGVPYWIYHSTELSERIENMLYDAGIEGFVYTRKVDNHLEIGAVNIELRE